MNFPFAPSCPRHLVNNNNNNNISNYCLLLLYYNYYYCMCVSLLLLFFFYFRAVLVFCSSRGYIGVVQKKKKVSFSHTTHIYTHARTLLSSSSGLRSILSAPTHQYTHNTHRRALRRWFLFSLMSTAPTPSRHTEIKRRFFSPFFFACVCPWNK